MCAVITLTTDFGLSDAYVAMMKGVILGINPRATIVDISHDVPPQDVRAAAFLLSSAYRYFPPGTIHVAVVDPGVGTARRALALSAGRALFVGPDNGVFSFLVTGARRQRVRAIHLTNAAHGLPHLSATFHGRDVFAPVAAHLSLDVPIETLGDTLDVNDLVTLPLPRARRKGGQVFGEVVHVDRFGNLETNVAASQVASLSIPVVEIGGRSIAGISRTYGEGKAGILLALIGSAGCLEIAVPGGSAQQHLGASVGTPVRVKSGISQP